MTYLPDDNRLQIEKLSVVFNDTTNSYKFYWFLAILDELKENGNAIISFESLNKRMISNVWYPLEVFKLSFGKSDGFKGIADLISLTQKIDDTVNSDTLTNQIDTKFDIHTRNHIYKSINNLSRWVPFRFIRPFFEEETRGLNDSKVNAALINLTNNLSATTPQKCVYHFNGNAIVINDIWKEYLIRHTTVLRAFTCWHLTKFVQRNNPNVVGISEKLFKPMQRSLKRNIESWKTFLNINKSVCCVYSGEIIYDNFSLDHFVPWSYVVHDLSWNIIPVRKEINSSKSDCLPSLEYIGTMTNLQYTFFQVLAENQKCKEILEDYCLLFHRSVNDIREMHHTDFETKLTEILSPMIQIASNMGFKTNWKYRLVSGEK